MCSTGTYPDGRTAGFFLQRRLKKQSGEVPLLTALNTPGHHTWITYADVAGIIACRSPGTVRSPYPLRLFPGHNIGSASARTVRKTDIRGSRAGRVSNSARHMSRGYFESEFRSVKPALYPGRAGVIGTPINPWETARTSERTHFLVKKPKPRGS